ncbi:hypothetical protein BDA99DRAFT_242772 [Phascolomyces articulosus]|uniref:Uncharacterized protein n=1 Tax=Phascolomyces articulosus TaxID=60185 RepID=A0AAD5KL24_9FUNG|nr:hypothetical protein BDA99DRAFT_242772 [Phascolomyces articulosus]
MATINEVIEQYVLEKDNHPLSLAKFIDTNRVFIASKTNFADDYKSKWSDSFHKIANEHGISVIKSSTNWDNVVAVYATCKNNNPIPEASEAAPSSSSNGSPSTVTTSTTTPKLTDEDIKKFKTMFASLNPEKFWFLQSGKIVEKCMYELAIKCTNEQSRWADHFSQGELIEIQINHKPTINQLSRDIEEYLRDDKRLVILYIYYLSFFLPLFANLSMIDIDMIIWTIYEVKMESTTSTLLHTKEQKKYSGSIHR